jgi:hypothetical protein
MQVSAADKSAPLVGEEAPRQPDPLPWTRRPHVRRCAGEAAIAKAVEDSVLSLSRSQQAATELVHAMDAFEASHAGRPIATRPAAGDPAQAVRADRA